MSEAIGKVSSLDGKFYAKATDGSLREISQGDEIYEGEVIVGNTNNSAIDSAIVTLDNATDIIVLGTQSQLFDASLYDQAFSEDDTVSSVESIEEMFDESVSDDALNDDIFDDSVMDETTDDVETEAGEEDSGKSLDGDEAEFAEHISREVDVSAEIREIEVDDSTPTIVGNAEPDTVVEVINEQNEVVGSTTADENGNFSITTTELGEGAQNLTIVTTTETIVQPIVVDIDSPATIEVTPVETITEDSVVAGTKVADIDANDEDSEITLSISDTDNYAIVDGEVVLTETGAALVNAGNDLPNFTVTANGVESSEVTPASTIEVITGTDGNDRLRGSDEDEIINAGAGNDSITAGAGDDTITGGTGRNSINAGEGDDTINITEGDGKSNYDVVRGGDGTDTVVFEGDREDYTIAHDDDRGRSVVTNIETGEPQYIYDDVENLQFADETVVHNSDSYDNDTVTGTDAADTINSGSGDDSISTGAGNDRINSGDGADTIDAGAGNDSITAGAGDDTITGGTGRNSINAGEGDDTINITEGDGKSNYDVVRGGDGTDTVVFEGDREDYTIAHDDDRGRSVVTNIETGEPQYIYDDVENLQFADETVVHNSDSYDNDTVTGTDAADTINSGSGDDSISTGAGNDRINSGDGADTIDAGAGNDSITAGAGDDTITGGTGRNSINAGEGDDTINITEGDGKSNYDVVRGGDGTDTVVFEGDREDYTIAHDDDRGRSVVTNIETGEPQYIYDDVENLQFADETVVHNSDSYDNDTVTGTDAADTINSGSGDDSISTGAGNDRINSGDGADTIDAGAGNDSITAGAGDDTITGGTGRNSINAGEGDDTINITEGDGKSNYDVVRGGDGTDTVVFEGDREDYTIAHDDDRGRSVVTNIETGEPQYIYDDVENLQFADGEYNTQSGEFTPEVVVQNTYNVGDGAGWRSTTNDLSDEDLSEYTEVVGNNSHDTIVGNESVHNYDGGAGNDNITATSGDDTIVGGAGKDTLDGGAGDDTFIVNGNQGQDTIIGGEGNDTIQGGEGDDTIGLKNFEAGAVENIDGGAGTNTIQVGDSAGWKSSSSDFSETDVTNVDAINGSNSHDTIVGNESVHNYDGGAGNDNITATSGDDTIVGGAGKDTLDGGAGDDTFIVNGNQGQDTIIGGEGNDTIQGGEGDDTIGLKNFEAGAVENIDGGAGTNTIQVGDSAGWKSSSSDFSETDVTNVDAINGSNSHDTIVGNESVHNYDGGAGNDNITATSGDDTIVGGAGKDTLDGGAGDDTFIVNGNQGQDTIIGGEGNDTIQGGEGDDTIGLKNFEAGAVENIDGGAGTNTIQVGDSAGWKSSSSDFSETDVTNVDAINGSNSHDTIVGNESVHNYDGGAGNDNITATSGDDTIVGGAGRDTIDAGAGDDTIAFDTADTIDGGEGLDTLAIDDGMSIDFSALDDKISNIEVLDLGEGAQNITSLSTEDVLDVTDADNILRIDGDSSDSIDLNTEGPDAEWTLGDFKTDAETGNTYQEATGDIGGETITLEISTDITIDQG
ncbi:hypothetical protein [Sulfurimonas sp.]